MKNKKSIVERVNSFSVDDIDVSKIKKMIDDEVDSKFYDDIEKKVKSKVMDLDINQILIEQILVPNVSVNDIFSKYITIKDAYYTHGINYVGVTKRDFIISVVLYIIRFQEYSIDDLNYIFCLDHEYKEEILNLVMKNLFKKLKFHIEKNENFNMETKLWLELQ